MNRTAKACQWACMLIAAALMASSSEAFQIHSTAMTQLHQKYMRKSAASTRAPALEMATWSNGQAIREYQGKLICSTSFFSTMIH